MGLIYAAIGFFIGWRSGQLHWKHGLLMLVLAGIYARTISYRQDLDFVGPFALAMIMQFIGYAIGIFLHRPKAED